MFDRSKRERMTVRVKELLLTFNAHYVEPDA